MNNSHERDEPCVEATKLAQRATPMIHFLRHRPYAVAERNGTWELLLSPVGVEGSGRRDGLIADVQASSSHDPFGYVNETQRAHGALRFGFMVGMAMAELSDQWPGLCTHGCDNLGLPCAHVGQGPDDSVSGFYDARPQVAYAIVDRSYFSWTEMPEGARNSLFRS